MGRRRASPLPGLVEDLTRRSGARMSFGGPVVQGDLVVIPVAAARFAFGGGGGRGRRRREAGEGGGGAAVVRPLGYIEMRDGRARYRRIRGVPPAVALILMALAAAALLARRSARPCGPPPAGGP
jgi:uncharacterized spore protein YtfJ